MNYRMYKDLYDYFTETPRTRNQYRNQSVLAGISPLHNGYYQYRDNMAYMDDYLTNRGFDYDYIRYPSRTPGYYGGYALGSGLRSVSRNVEDLYSPDVSYKPNRNYRDPSVF